MKNDTIEPTTTEEELVTRLTEARSTYKRTINDAIDVANYEISKDIDGLRAQFGNAAVADAVSSIDTTDDATLMVDGAYEVPVYSHLAEVR